MVEIYAAFALIGPTLLSVGIAWLFIRQGKPSVGVFTGLGSIAILLVVGIVLINKDIADCVIRNQQEYPNMPAMCGEWSGVIIMGLVVCSLIDVTLFLLTSLTIVRRYKASFTWLNALLLIGGLIAITISTINYIDIKPYFEALPIPINAVKYYASLAGIILGVVLIVFAIARARKHDVQYSGGPDR